MPTLARFTTQYNYRFWSGGSCNREVCCRGIDWAKQRWCSQTLTHAAEEQSSTLLREVGSQKTVGLSSTECAGMVE